MRAEGASDPGWSGRKRLVLLAADALHADGAIGDALWAELAAAFDEQELIELCLLVGHYEMLAMTLNTLRVQLDPRAARRERRGPRAAAAAGRARRAAMSRRRQAPVPDLRGRRCLITGAAQRDRPRDRDGGGRARRDRAADRPQRRRARRDRRAGGARRRRRSAGRASPTSPTTTPSPRSRTRSRPRTAASTSS